MKTIKVIVTGRVQGVSFRFYTQQKARNLCITGTVRNLDDGSVEIIASGTDVTLQELQEWARKGPALAKVADLHVETLFYTPYDDFKILKE